MKILKSMLTACAFACLVQTASARTNLTSHGEMVSVSSAFFDFSSVSEVDKRRFRSVRSSKFRTSVRRMRSSGRGRRR